MNNYQKMTIKNLWSRIQNQRNLDFGSYGSNKWIYGKEWLKEYRRWKKSKKIYGFRIWQCDKDNYIAYRGSEKIKIWNINNAEFVIKDYLIKNNKLGKKKSNIIKIRIIEKINNSFQIYYLNYDVKNNKEIELNSNEIKAFHKETSKLKKRKIIKNQIKLTGTKEGIMEIIYTYLKEIDINKVKFYEDKGHGYRVYLSINDIYFI